MIFLLQAAWKTPKWSDAHRGSTIHNDFYYGFSDWKFITDRSVQVVNLYYGDGKLMQFMWRGLYTHLEFVHDDFALSIIV